MSNVPKIDRRSSRAHDLSVVSMTAATSFPSLTMKRVGPALSITVMRISSRLPPLFPDPSSSSACTAPSFSQINNKNRFFFKTEIEEQRGKRNRDRLGMEKEETQNIRFDLDLELRMRTDSERGSMDRIARDS
ncbi:hypothetical protein U1Q18_021496 [Sarracenia purpurea var. burkii]